MTSRERFETALRERAGPTGDTPGYPGPPEFYPDQKEAAWWGWQANEPKPPVVPIGWKVQSIPPWSALTDKVNAETAWMVTRTEAPFCDKKDNRQWTGPTMAEALRRAHVAMGMEMK